LDELPAWPGVFFFLGLLTAQNASRFAEVRLNSKSNAARGDFTGAHRLQIRPGHIADDIHVFRSIYDFDIRPDHWLGRTVLI